MRNRIWGAPIGGHAPEFPPSLCLEDVFSVPREEAWVRAECRIERFDGFAIGAKESVEAFAVVDVA